MKNVKIWKSTGVRVAVLAALAIATMPSLASAATMPLDYQASDAADMLRLSEDKGHDLAKEAILRRVIMRQISQNEAAHVITDVTVKELQTHRTLASHNEDVPHFAASVNKLPIAWLTLQDLRAGKFTMTDVVSWSSTDVRAGEGVFDQPGAPLQATVQEVIYDMLNHSGNTAARILVNYKLGLAATVNERLSHYPHITQTRLQPLPHDPTRFFLGNTTSRESLWILEQLLKEKDPYGQFMQQALVTNIYTDIGVKSQLAGNDYIVLANKIGLLDDSDGYNRHDVGLIYNTRTHKAYGYSFLTTTPEAESDASVPQAEYSLKKMGRAILRFAGDRRQAAEADLKAEAFSKHGQPGTRKKMLY